jgi:hypothetical protein
MLQGMHGKATMNRNTAIETRRLSIKAIEALSELTLILRGHLSENEYERGKKAIGSIIGTIQTDLLDPLYRDYPELDDLET